MKAHSKNIALALKKLMLVMLAVLASLTMLIACGGSGDDDNGGEPPIPDIPAGGIRITVNYFRPDGDYNDWNMWIWLVGKEGSSYNFDRKATIGGSTWVRTILTFDSVTANSDGDIFGTIVRMGEWSDREDFGDRMIPASAVKDGDVTLYFIKGVETTYYTEEDAIAAMEDSLKLQITTAAFTTMSRVYFVTSEKITDKSIFKIKEGDTVVGTLDCSDSANSSVVGEKYGAVNLNSGVKMDPSKTYKIVDEPATFDDDANFIGRDINKSGAYSSKEFEDLYKYEGTLGAEYTAEQTKFTVWSPYATAMKVNIYAAGTGGTATSYDMTKGEKGTWTYTLSGDQNGKYYTYTVTNGSKSSEVVDPYARSGGKNGERGMILDLNATNPTGWDTQQMPTLASNCNAVIWEAQLRDVTIHESSGVSEANRGKFLGLTETGTKNTKGQSTALDYLKKLGVTEVHFQPLFDFASVNEGFTTATYNKDGEYNWGYDPLNYNMPEGSYSSDPADGAKRVNEMKQMVMALHNAGIQVVMDVVYNHVSSAQNSNFEKLMPGYYFRMNDAGGFYNGSGCGNETKSENYMFGRFMIDSVKYWTEEYKIDGFRFDLMALHDVDTMNKLAAELKAINPDVILYGEGWTGGTTGLSSDKQASKDNAAKTPDIAYFNDTVRDGLKGSVFNIKETGYIQGSGANSDNAVYNAAKGGTFSSSPTQNINYTACHDNSLLWDKLNASVKAEKDVLKAMNRLAAVSVITGQGIAFIPAGEEMMRSKPTTKDNKYDNRPNNYMTDSSYYFADNSYKSPDSVNAINWDLLDENSDMVEFYTQLIAIKKTFPQFSLKTKAEITANLVNIDNKLSDGVAVYAVKDPNSNEYVVVVLNNKADAKKVAVPQGDYTVYVNGDKANATTPLSTLTGVEEVTIAARSAMIMKVTLEKTPAELATAWTYSVANA